MRNHKYTNEALKNANDINAVYKLLSDAKTFKGQVFKKLEKLLNNDSSYNHVIVDKKTAKRFLNNGYRLNNFKKSNIKSKALVELNDLEIDDALSIPCWFDIGNRGIRYTYVRLFYKTTIKVSTN